MTTAELQKLKQRYEIVGNYEGLLRALDVALKIAPVDLPVLIEGENGVGKEIFPRIIHDFSPRKGKRYLAVNCGAIPEGTVDSELFGHERGAFTGAVEKREGYFSVADGGTLFLDEVGELPLQTQARLLRVLETHEFIPVGSSEIRTTNVRIVAATNVNMEKAVEEGKFREDLYYRLNALTVKVPPLRERGEDIVLLFRKFALEMSEKYHMPPIRLDESARQLLMAYDWPGNVRQLKNLAESMSVTSEVRELNADQLAGFLPKRSGGGQLVVAPKDKGEHSFESEREILYKILFDLRRDVTELKRTVSEKLGQDTPKGEPTFHTGITILPTHSSHHNHDAVDEISEAEEVEDNTHYESITLDEQEKELIRQALEQTHGHRSLAAEMLGISERTLYRKIRKYELDN
ncbi:MAG: sigma-54-dependent Fis family transcriptional regulator [Alloprevotella sp.]|nr:sigma-54-dependent Fis family transcriptional regulator [Alloprevotella sp.]